MSLTIVGSGSFDLGWWLSPLDRSSFEMMNLASMLAFHCQDGLGRHFESVHYPSNHELD